MHNPLTIACVKRFYKFIQRILFPHLKYQEIIGHIFPKKLLGLVPDFQGREETVGHLFHLRLIQWFSFLDILVGYRCRCIVIVGT